MEFEDFNFQSASSDWSLQGGYDEYSFDADGAEDYDKYVLTFSQFTIVRTLSDSNESAHDIDLDFEVVEVDIVNVIEVEMIIRAVEDLDACELDVPRSVHPEDLRSA